jgi:class 3 adenylate cyclase
VGSAANKAPEVLAERHPITVMFCDLVGSTALASRLDAFTVVRTSR